MSFIVLSATNPSGSSSVKSVPITVGLSWLHIIACRNQLPVMFQPQKMGLSTPAARSLPQASITSSQVVGRLVSS